ncbi:MAG: hypothetical protein D6823_06040 [Chloroflexi bacterium]|nr:MAG: hypothetical protein D6823_06040 [Chloroflexota bacterium]
MAAPTPATRRRGAVLHRQRPAPDATTAAHAAGDRAANTLRTTVAATVGNVIRLVSAGPFPVRGLFQVTWLVIGATTVSHIRRLLRSW